jgi:hypothetical protein
MRFIFASKISGRNLPPAHVGTEFVLTTLGFYLLTIFR